MTVTITETTIIIVAREDVTDAEWVAAMHAHGIADEFFTGHDVATVDGLSTWLFYRDVPVAVAV